MVISITALAVDKDYADNTILTEAQLDALAGVGGYTSIEDYCNTQLRYNLTQVAKDSFGQTSVYTFNDDGNQSRTATLFNKQYSTKLYNGGDISIGVAADVGWGTVDAVNASISFTPEIAGQYKVTFIFTNRITSTATTEMTADISWRLTDGATAGSIINTGGRHPATAGGSGVFYVPVTLVHVFDWTAVAKQVVLQKYIRTATAINANVVGASATTGEFFAIIEKI